MGLKIIRKESSFEQISKKWTNDDDDSSGSEEESGSEELSDTEIDSLDALNENRSEKKPAEDKSNQPGRHRPETSQTVKDAKDKAGSALRVKPVVSRDPNEELTPKKGNDHLSSRAFLQRTTDFQITQPRRAATQRLPQFVSSMPFNDENDLRDKAERSRLIRPNYQLDNQLGETPRALRSGSKSGVMSPHPTSTNKEKLLEKETPNPSKGKTSFQKDGPHDLSPIRPRPNRSSLNPHSDLESNKLVKASVQHSTNLHTTELLPLEEIALSASKVPPKSKTSKTNLNKTSKEGSRTGESLQSAGLNLRNLTEPEPDLDHLEIPQVSQQKVAQIGTNDSKQIPKKPKSKLKVFVADSTQDPKPSSGSQSKTEQKISNFNVQEYQSYQQKPPETSGPKPSSELIALHFNTRGTLPPRNQDRNPAFTASAFKVTTMGMDYHPALTTRISETETSRDPEQPVLEMQTFHADVVVPNAKKPDKPILRPSEAEEPEQPTAEQLEQINLNTKRYLDQTRDDSSYNTDVLNTMYKRNNEQNEIPEIPLKNIIPIKDKGGALPRSPQEAIEISSPQASEPADERDREGREFFPNSGARVGHEESYLLLSAEQRDFYKRTDLELDEFNRRFEEWAQLLSTREAGSRVQEGERLFLEFRKALARLDLSKIPLEVIYNHHLGYYVNNIFGFLQQNRESIPSRYASLLVTLQECLDMWNKRVEDDLFYSEDLNEKFQVPRPNREKPALGKRTLPADLEVPRIFKPTQQAARQPKQEEEPRHTSLGSLTAPLHQPSPQQSKKVQQLEDLINYIEKVLLETHQLSEASRAAQQRGLDANNLRWSLNERTKQEAINMLISGLRRCPGVPQEKQAIATELESKIRSLRNKEESQYWRAVRAVAEHLSRETVLKQQEVLSLARSDLSHFNLYLSAITELNMSMLNNH